MQPNSIITMCWVSVGLAVVLIVTPFIFGFATQPQLVASLLGGGAVAVLSGAAIATHRTWESWATMLVLNLVAGAAIFFSPLILHYNDNNAATWIHMLVGTAISVIAFIQIWNLEPAGSPRPTR